MGGLCKLSLFSQPDSGGGVCDIDCPWTWVLYPQGPRRSQAGDPLSRSQYYKEELLVVEGYHVLPGGFFFFGKLRPEEVLGIALGPSEWLA